MVSAVSDAAARATALNPAQSFIVQAPAGSGKTELLIQRYLALLATVQEPEQVVAITFTRKAAAEMRRRVQRALRAAADGEAGTEPHERATLALARAVVERDREHDWTLQAQPQRLRIDTLDAFNVWLAQQLPLLADGVAAARIVEDAADCYRAAARQTVTAVTEAGQVGMSVRTLLRTFDNDAAAFEKLLAALLPKRDQWLRHLVGPSPAELRPVLEHALQRLVDDELGALGALCPESLLAELAPLLRHAAESATDEALQTTLAPWLAIERPAPAGAAALAAWRGVAALLLTRAGEWRKQVTKRQGFGPEHSQLRDRCRALLGRLRDNELLRTGLAAAADLPEPRYTERQWQNLAALRIVLIRLAAELKVLFAERRCVDFVELALAAQRALGQVDAPSELLLALDRRIQHLLVDEFQDTSQSQLRLLELLTAGWQADDGRTLFLVGDPMQSIYRFRDADMSLFLKAKLAGVGTVRLESITLQQNFRSAPQIVEWVNAVFAVVFPHDDQIATGKAGFRPSSAARASGAEQFVRVHPLTSLDLRAEVAQVVDILDAERQRAPGQSIAVLVQSRSHLAGLRDLLRAKGWPVHAVEIDALGEHQLAQDLVGLTRALLHLGDRIAWLAVLRAPWCGIGWADLEALCADAPRRAIWELLHDPERIRRLSSDGQRRAAATAAVLAAAIAERGMTSLARWVELTWNALEGPACLDDDGDLQVAGQFFTLLARAERYGDLDDPARLHEALAAAQPQGDPPREQGIEIMTMHRAKGLEFDTVVLLGLGREPRPDDAKALYWMQRVAAGGAEDLIMAPSTGDSDGARLSDFVSRTQRQRDLAERARLLYVATTRARERLHLVWQLPPAKSQPASNSLLAHLWPALAAETAKAAAPVGAGAPLTGEPESFQPVLRRLVTPAHADAAAVDVVQPSVLRQPEFTWVGQAAVHVGTVVHRYLQQIADRGVDSWTTATTEASTSLIDRELRLLGVDPVDVGPATARVMAAVTAALADPRGRWVLGRHAEARSELRMTLHSGDVLEHVRLDRTFVDDGTRWIIDFKTGQHEGSDMAAFLASEVERYRPQLERYARAIAAVDPRPVHVGLYFPLLQAFRSWPAGRE